MINQYTMQIHYSCEGREFTTNEEYDDWEVVKDRVVKLLMDHMVVHSTFLTDVHVRRIYVRDRSSGQIVFKLEQ